MPTPTVAPVQLRAVAACGRSLRRDAASALPPLPRSAPLAIELALALRGDARPFPIPPGPHGAPASTALVPGQALHTVPRRPIADPPVQLPAFPGLAILSATPAHHLLVARERRASIDQSERFDASFLRAGQAGWLESQAAGAGASSHVLFPPDCGADWRAGFRVLRLPLEDGHADHPRAACHPRAFVLLQPPPP